MKKIILLVTILLLSILHVNPVFAATGDSPAEADTAVLGTNTGTITVEGATYYFNFSGSASNFYEFSLSAGPSTDFDLTVMAPDGKVVAGSYSGSYPEVVFTTGYSLYTIAITSFFGTGDFTLNISMITVPQLYLGVNNLNMDNSSTQMYVFYGTPMVPHEFRLNADPSTDFDIELYDESGNYIDGSYRVDYPDIASGSSSSGIFVVYVYAATGTGPYTIEIVEKTIPKAYLGENYGEILSVGEEIQFQFDGVQGQWYEISLTADPSTDFDLEVWDNTGSYLDGSYRVDYPDFVQVEATTPTLWISIYSLVGTGPFTLTITEISSPVMIDTYIFSENIKQGDQFVWGVDYVGPNQVLDFAAGDNITLTANLDGDKITANPDFEGTIPSNGFSLVHNNHDVPSYFLFLFVLPTTAIADNGSHYGIDLVLAYLFGVPSVNVTDEGTTIHYKDTYGEIWFDKYTGVMTHVKTEDYEFTLLTDLAQPEEPTTSEPVSNNDTTSESVAPDIGLADLPVDWVPLAFTLLALPLLRRKLKVKR